MKIDMKAFALACALVWGLGLFTLTWWIIAFDGASGESTLIGRLYRGRSNTSLGSLIGLAWAFFDALIAPLGQAPPTGTVRRVIFAASPGGGFG